MFRDVEEVQSSGQVAGDLEQYRRLIELQKQMIKLAKQNEKAKRECEFLRERAAVEVMARLKTRGSLRDRLILKAGKVLKRLPKFAAADSAFTLTPGGSIAPTTQKSVRS